MASDNKPGWPVRLWAALGGGLVAAVGAVLLAGGAWLVALEGSPYYFLAGAAVLATGVLLIRRHPAAGFLYAATLAITVAWADWEAGLAFWPLLPRLFAPAVLGFFVLTIIPTAPRGRLRSQAAGAVLLTSAGCLFILAAAVPATFTWGQAETPVQAQEGAPAVEGAADWRDYGHDAQGTRYAPIDQINRENVARLRPAWTFRTGEKPNRGDLDEDTPIQVGDTLYVCTPTDAVIALDADTGRQKWRYDPQAKPWAWNRCRGVAYWDSSQPKASLRRPAGVAPTTPGPKPVAHGAVAAACEERILVSTIDARLIALDAKTGKTCAGFGQGGTVDLKAGMGGVKRGFYFQTSAPTVANGRVIVGGWVADNQEVGEPSGVVRAFDVVTGALVWAWDVGDPAVTRLPPSGATYTRGTPNVWSSPAVDPALGLIYLPTGNATPDYWGSHRSTQSEAYSSSVVALDIATGRERWRFQTVHHDLWDYDVASQPMLIDFPGPDGKTTPALIQLTKRGQIFVLDRKTGEPLTRVVEVRVPKSTMKGEWTWATQPYSVQMPAVGVGPLTEAKMWGATPLDQLDCRIQFRRLRYEGDFTPPGDASEPSLQFPGNAGGMNWGSGAYDPQRDLLIVSSVRLPQTVFLTPTRDPAQSPNFNRDRPQPSMSAVAYKSVNRWMLSHAFAPCLQPPHGLVTAIDLKTRQIAWQVPAGTAEAEGPFGLASHLSIPIGTIGLGGPITTAGGVTFRSATTDPYLRAYDNATGRELWKAALPVASTATPMTYVSPRTGRQYVVVTAGGALLGGPRGDYVMAFALPAAK